MSSLKRARGASLPPIPGFSKEGVDDHVTLDSDELLRMEKLYATESTVQACARILQSSVLGGMRLMRNGAPVDLRPAFLDHLNNHWLAFARAAIDSVLTHGFVGVVLIPAPLPAFGAKPAKHADENVIPVVADFSCMRIEMHRKGPAVREYHLVNHDGSPVPNASVFVKSHPSHEGETTSPLNSIKGPLVFMQRLVEFALQAEAVATRQQIVTQPISRLAKQSPNLDTESMFFDNGADLAALAPLSVLSPLNPTLTLARIAQPAQGRRVRKGRRAPAIAVALRPPGRRIEPGADAPHRRRGRRRARRGQACECLRAAGRAPFAVRLPRASGDKNDPHTQRAQRPRVAATAERHPGRNRDGRAGRDDVRGVRRRIPCHPRPISTTTNPNPGRALRVVGDVAAPQVSNPT